MKYQAKEPLEKEFARFILQSANQRNIKVRELEKACETAIRYCREVLVPTPESLQTNQEN